MSGTLSGKLSPAGARLEGKLSSVVSSFYPPYTGEYEVTPRVEVQTLDTAGKVLAKDITVHAVPYYETSNEQDGWTVHIAEEV